MVKKILFLSIIILGFSCNSSPEKDQDIILEKISKAIKNRVFKDVLREKSRYTYEGKAFLIESFEDRLVIIDNNLNIVEILNNDFNVNTKKIKSGEGPGEHSGIKRFYPLKDNTYVTFDHSQQLIRKFSDSDSLLIFKNIKSGEWIHDITHLNDNNFLLTLTAEDYFKFIIYNVKQDEIIREYSILELVNGVVETKVIKNLPEDKTLVFEGYFASGKGDHVIYSCNKAGLIFAFNKNGDFHSIIKTIDNLPVPSLGKSEISPGYFIFGVVPDLRGNYSRAVNDNKVFILSNFLLSNYQNKRPIDVYDITSSKYLYSFFVPNLEDGQMPEEISVYDENLFVMYENGTILKYSYVL